MALAGQPNFLRFFIEDDGHWRREGDSSPMSDGDRDLLIRVWATWPSDFAEEVAHSFVGGESAKRSSTIAKLHVLVERGATAGERAAAREALRRLGVE